MVVQPGPAVEIVPPAPSEGIAAESPTAEAAEQLQPAEETADTVPIIEESAPPASQFPDFGNMTPDKALTAILQIQAKNTVGAMEANSQSQPDNETDADFGLVREKPIFTLALRSFEGIKKTICPKCNHTLPKDSAFCQFCGNFVSTKPVAPVVVAPVAPTFGTAPVYTKKSTQLEKTASVGDRGLTRTVLLSFVGAVVAMSVAGADGVPNVGKC